MFSAQEGTKGSKMELQKTSKMKLFLESNKTTESCSRLHAELVFEVWRTPKPHFFRDHFRKPSSCCTGAVVSQIFDKNGAPESVQNRSKIQVGIRPDRRARRMLDISARMWGSGLGQLICKNLEKRHSMFGRTRIVFHCPKLVREVGTLWCPCVT